MTDQPDPSAPSPATEPEAPFAVSFVVYETATGRISRWGHCPPHDVEKQPLDAGQAILTHDDSRPVFSASVDITVSPPALKWPT